jgi:hypothetical protein
VALGAPRRLALSVSDLAARQADLSETLTGPPVSAAFDKEGKPTRAAAGFAQKVGVPVESLTVVEVAGPKGKVGYVAAKREVAGQETRALLPALLAEIARAIPWKKSMRWANLDESFVRPVHWIVALYGGEVVPLELYGVKSGRETRGHRFLAPGAIALDGRLEGYRQALRQAFVLVDPQARKTEIEAELARVSRESGVAMRADPELLDEVVNLVEYPKAVVGSFDARHLEIPPEVIISAMRVHQRYFATEKDGKLENRFVTVAGTVDPDLEGAARRATESVRPAAPRPTPALHRRGQQDQSLEAKGRKARRVESAFIKGSHEPGHGRRSRRLRPGKVPDGGLAKLRRAVRACARPTSGKWWASSPSARGVMGQPLRAPRGRLTRASPPPSSSTTCRAGLPTGCPPAISAPRWASPTAWTPWPAVSSSAWCRRARTIRTACAGPRWRCSTSSPTETGTSRWSAWRSSPPSVSAAPTWRRCSSSCRPACAAFWSTAAGWPPTASMRR